MSSVPSSTNNSPIQQPEKFSQTPNPKNSITTLVSTLLAPPKESPKKTQDTSILDWIGKKIYVKKQEQRDPGLIGQTQKIKDLLHEKKDVLKNGTKLPTIFDISLGLLTSYIESDFDGASTHQELIEKVNTYISILNETFTFIDSLQKSLVEKKEEIAASQTKENLES